MLLLLLLLLLEIRQPLRRAVTDAINQRDA
jgi:hypothetical protein